jgi:hypothetical protein
LYLTKKFLKFYQFKEPNDYVAVHISKPAVKVIVNVPVALFGILMFLIVITVLA